ncbi:MAG: glycosyltransferase [Bacteroidetes bacterium]|nr:glycosyltransferase [Bacteroidota bacterium]MBI3483264.1 glycosyltransferase [Bacteroidota bacterium]
MPSARPIKKVLVAALDWGLGHATRSIPVINEFLKQGCEVQIASSGGALVLLKEEFPLLRFHTIASYNATYSSVLPFMIKILIQMPKFILAIRKEHWQIEKIVHNEKIDLLISDNRYGCWSTKIPSVLITHQVNIIMPPAWKWLEGVINYGNHWQIGKFTDCWIPDFPNGITGRMTGPTKMKTKFIGMVSRFTKMNVPIKYDVLAIISGPEPQRSLLEAKIKSQLLALGLSYFIVKGKPGAEKPDDREADHLASKKLNELIESSSLVIGRSGYTTVMDLWKLGKKAVFIPTPGQTEQEYLAKELMRRGIAFYQDQNDFDLKYALEESKKYKGFEGFEQQTNLLADVVENLLSPNA